MEEKKIREGTDAGNICLPLRPHHGMCLAFFAGKGYSEAFVANMKRIQNVLSQNPLVELTQGADVICGCCPNDCGGVCRMAGKVSRYDAAVLDACGLGGGETVPWADFSGAVREWILDAGRRGEICGDCEWNAICRREG